MIKLEVSVSENPWTKFMDASGSTLKSVEFTGSFSKWWELMEAWKLEAGGSNGSR